MNARATAGFTLLEVVVALAVLGFLMVGLAQGVRFGLAAWSRQDRVIDRRADLDATDRTLRALVGQMDPGTARDPAAIAGSEQRLGFTSVLPTGGDVTAGMDGEAADMLLLVDAGHRLLLRWTPHIHARRVGPAPEPHTEVLLGGIERLELAYWRMAPGGGWTQEWTDRALPGLVRFRLVFPSGAHRHWPDIVAAPLLAKR